MIQPHDATLPGDLRVACIDGRRLLARADLLSRCRTADCPPPQRLLLQMLEADDVAAPAAHANPKCLDADLDLLRALEGNRRAYDFDADEPVAESLSELVQALPGDLGIDAPVLHQAQVNALAEALPAYEELIPTFTAGFRVEPDVQLAALLAEALETALPKLHGREQAWEAIASLWLCAGNTSRARAKALEGLEECRYCPGLAMLLAQLEMADDANAPDDHIVDLVRDVAAVFPEWQDLQRTSRRLEAAA